MTNAKLSDTEMKKLNDLLKGVKLTTTAGSEHPNYVLFWTNEELLSLFAQALTNDKMLSTSLPLPPSSTIIFEFYEDASKVLQVRGFLNDQSVTLAGCKDLATCVARDFSDALAADAAKIPNVADYCKGGSAPDKSTLTFI